MMFKVWLECCIPQYVATHYSPWTPADKHSLGDGTNVAISEENRVDAGAL